MEENNGYFNQKNLSELFNSNENSKNSKDFYSSFTDKNESNNNSLSLSNERIDNSQKNEIYFNKENSLDENNDFESSLSFISFEKEDFMDDSSLLQLMKSDKHKTISLEKMIEIIKYLIEFHEEKKVNFDNTYIRCFHIEENKTQSETCNCVPLIEKNTLGLRFSCDGNNFKFFSIEKIIKLILSEKKIFVEFPPNKENKVNIEPKNGIKDNLNEIQIIKVKYYILGKDISDLQNRAHMSVNKALKKIDELMEKYKELMSNKNKILKNGYEQKLKSIFFSLSRNFNNFIYFFIIKRLIYESFGFIDGKNPNINNLKKNLLHAKDILKKCKNKQKDELFDNRKTKKKKKFKLRWMIPFYYKEEIKNDLEKNIFIAISSDGNVLIYLFNDVSKIYPNEKALYKLIKKINIDNNCNQFKIMKLKNIFTCLQLNRKNNYFLISSFLQDKAIIINLKEKYETTLEERYQYEMSQTIKFERRLYSSIEIEFNEHNYLLNYHKIFTLGIYNENKNEIEFKDINVKMISKNEDLSDKKNVYGPLIQGNINKNLIIAMTIIPKQKIDVYEIDKSNKDLSLIHKGSINFNKEDNYISIQNNNYFLYKDKYLLLASIENTITQKKGGIYIFDIENFSCINIFQNSKVASFRCILGINDNTLICSMDNYTIKQYYKTGAIALLNAEEKNNNLV